MRSKPMILIALLLAAFLVKLDTTLNAEAGGRDLAQPAGRGVGSAILRR